MHLIGLLAADYSELPTFDGIAQNQRLTAGSIILAKAKSPYQCNIAYP